MTMMKLDWTYEGDSNINLSINITDSVAILSDDSGTGKTFMFEMLESYFVAKGIAYKSLIAIAKMRTLIGLYMVCEKLILYCLIMQTCT